MQVRRNSVSRCTINVSTRYAFCGPGCVGRELQDIIVCATGPCAIYGAACASDAACSARLSDYLRMDVRYLLRSDANIDMAANLFDCVDRYCGKFQESLIVLAPFTLIFSCH